MKRENEKIIKEIGDNSYEMRFGDRPWEPPANAPRGLLEREARCKELQRMQEELQAKMKENNEEKKRLQDVYAQAEDKRREVTAELGRQRRLAYANNANIARAVADFWEAICLRPNMAKAYARRGEVYTKQGKTSKAQADFAKARELGWTPE